MPPTNEIHFAEVQDAVPWRDFLSTHFALHGETLESLLNFGAIYRNQKRWRPSGDEILQKGDLVRVHKRPRRFPVERLHARALRAVERDWVVLWKPHGIPSHETLDNLLENAKAWTERELSRLDGRGAAKLFSLNRLDVGTRGWLLFARTPEFARAFNIEMQEGRVRKFYESLSGVPRAGVGLWRHAMAKSERAPKNLSVGVSDEFPLPCELRVEWLRFLSVASVHSRVELITGRTHQIRAQFAFEGAPLWGDVLYGSDVPSPSVGVDDFALSCERLEFSAGERRWEFERGEEAPGLREEWEREADSRGGAD
jgi:23S rRNA pseudouridine1911/1915/1917 synthase